MDRDRLQRLHERAQADRWKLPPEVLSNALERSAEKAFAGRNPSEGELDSYYDSLHLADLAVACACAMGREDAWNHFVLEFRPAMYRAADAIDPHGGAREIAESLYAELFGLREKDGIRQSVFRYFHGRSSLSTWLRSLVSQRFIDRHRETRRLEPLPDESAAAPLRAASTEIDPDRARYVAAMRAALSASIAALDPRDRLRLACYYAQGMTLAAIGKLTREHEATVSRQLSRTRRAIREDVERRLRDEHRFPPAAIEECFASIVNDAGNLDLAQWLDAGSPAGSSAGALAKAEALAKAGRKNSELNRSNGEAAEGTESAENNPS